MALSYSLASLATLMGLAPHEAIALPETVSCAARKSGMAEGAMVRECLSNDALRDFLAQVCRNVMTRVAA